MRVHVVEQRGEILLAIFHNKKYGVEATAHHNLLELDDVSMFDVEQKINFSQARYRDAVFFLFHADAFEGYDFVRLDVAGSVDYSVGSLTDAVEFLVLVDISFVFLSKKCSCNLLSYFRRTKQKSASL